MRHFLFAVAAALFACGPAGAWAADKPGTAPSKPDRPASRTTRSIQGWTVRIDDRLLAAPHDVLGARALRLLEAKLADIRYVMADERVAKLQTVQIVLDLSCGKLGCMQYHPDAGWLKENGYSEDLVKCVHIPEASDLANARSINQQPWVILHELAHAYHDQVLDFDEPRILRAWEQFKKSGRGEKALLYDGRRVRHYGLTDQKEFFAEMTEAYFGMNDFFPFNRAELLTAEPEIHELMRTIWGPVTGVGPQDRPRPAPTTRSTSRPMNETAAHEKAATTMWYAQPAETWVEALPVGNGRLGAMVFGQPHAERIQLNEQTVWTGGPYDPTQPGGPAALPEIRRLVFEGKFFEAEDLFARTMMGKPAEQMKYQPLGNLTLEMPEHLDASEYRRELDLETGLACVSYRAGGVHYRREVLASRGDQVIAVRLTADRPGAVSLSARLAGVTNYTTRGDETHAVEVAPPHRLILRGRTATHNGVSGRVQYLAEVRVLNEGGKVQRGRDSLAVRGADAVTLLIAAGTNFKRYDDLSARPEDRVGPVLDAAQRKGLDRIRTDHLADHRGLFGRVTLCLPAGEASLRPTDQRLRTYDAGRDAQLMALMFQYGRYLLMGSSRPGGQPANLQGLWNEDMNPSWECKFTANINLQMNYWQAETANLAECFEPLAEMVRELAQTGAKVATVHYGARGWVFHQNTDQWRHAAPMDGPTWGTFATGGAWLCTHLWEHYRFGGDREFLARVYPLLKGSAQFFLDTLVEHPTRKCLVTCPSTSPENFPAWPGNKRYLDKFTGIELPGTTICAGSTIDIQILRDLFEACEQASALLGVDAAFREQLAAARKRLPPMQVGRQGQLQEWLEDWDDLEPEHRHISHLYGLFPGSRISPETTPDLAAAARVTLAQRTDEGTGFGMAWKAACWARLLDGDRANRCLANLVAKQTCPNLLSKCFRSPQVDGAMGATAAIAELLLQSQTGELRLLPALPSAWASGRATGLRARGGFEVDLDWQDGRLTRATVRSSLGGPCRVRCGQAALQFDTQPGRSYPLALTGQTLKAAP